SGAYFHPDALASVTDEVKAQIDFSDIAQARITLKMWQFEKPVIAALNGLAIGGAFTMCVSCADLIYASEHAWATLPFARLGIVPELASSYLLPRLLGFQRANEIMFFGERITAQQLYEWGLANKVLPHDELIAYARDMAMRLVPPGGAGLAIKLVKRALRKPLIDQITTALGLENEGLTKAMTTEDFMEAIAARTQKRAPVFKGR
ncbi:enoyl-CoA hydratase-related protein, partial [Thermodesulfobacteriota bacterium]